MLKTRPISDEARQALRASLRSVGVDPSRADQACDLACHAAEQAMGQLLAITGRGSDDGVKLMALEIGSQMLAAEANFMFALIHKLSRAENLPTNEIQVTL